MGKFDNYECEGQMSLFDLIIQTNPEKPQKTQENPKTESAPVCMYSEHSCNKVELWKQADSLDALQCPHVCCRKCNTRLCGARCNGSEEPKAIREWIGDDYIPTIVNHIRNNSLFEPWRKKLDEGLEEKGILEYDNRKKLYKLFDSTMFRLTRRQYFTIDDGVYCLYRPNDKPGFEETGILFVIECKKDSLRVLANLNVRELALAMIEPKEADVRGICDDGYCPTCNHPVDDLQERCECGQRLTWNFWKKMNDKGEEE